MWLSLIADDTIRKQAIDNYDEKYYYQIPIVENIKDAFSYSFSWEKSPQHIIYWLNILKNPIPLRPSVKIENTVVNVTSQEEWDLVSDYYGYEWISSEYIDYEKETCISCDYCLGCRIKNYKDGTILSFKEWENAICGILSEDNEELYEENIILNKTERGFDISEFTDLYNNVCSIQKSSLAFVDAIWLGIDNPKLTIYENETKGKYLVTEIPSNFSVNCRMHLNREQVAKLLPLLNKFVETGELS